MREKRYTAGPWVAEEDREDILGHFDILDRGQHCVAHIDNQYVDPDIACANWLNDYGDAMRANAHLIAASPDLLEALEATNNLLGDLLDEGLGTLDAPVAVQIAENSAALAKAYGESE